MAFRKQDSPAYRATLREFARMSSHPEFEDTPQMEELFLQSMNMTPTLQRAHGLPPSFDELRHWLFWLFENWSPHMVDVDPDTVH